MKINIELELHPNTEVPFSDWRDENIESRHRIIAHVPKINYFGECNYEPKFSPESTIEALISGEEGFTIAPWVEVDGWISVSELKEQVMKASGK